MQHSLEQVKKTYRSWGKYPLLYKLACVITFIGQEKILRRLAVQALELKRGDVVLDLACGTGLNHPFLEESVGPEGKIIAFDYSDEMLAASKHQAEKNGWKNISFIQGDAAELSLDVQIDGILSTLGISAVPEHRRALERAFAVLKDGKKISILDARLPTGIWRIFNPLIAYVYEHWASWDYAENIPKDLQEIFGRVEIKTYNSGTLFIASATKNAS